MKSNYYDVVFLSFTKLTTGAGTENFLLNIVKNTPQDFKVHLIETNYEVRKRLPLWYVDKMTESVERIEIHSFYALKPIDILMRYFSDPKKTPFTPMKGVARTLMTSILYYIYSYINKNELKLLSVTDAIYLILNDDQRYISRKKCIVIGSTHCSDLKPKSLPLKLAESLSFLKNRGIDVFHITSKQIFNELTTRKEKFLLEVGVDTDLFFPVFDKKRDSAVKFLFVGRLETSKGLIELINAWKLLKISNTELHVVGDGELKDFIIDYSKESAGIIYHGTLKSFELAELYRNCDVFIFPTKGDVSGLVVLEALSSGLYVIASDILKGVWDDFASMGMLEYVEVQPLSIAKNMEKCANKIDIFQNRVPRVYNHIKQHYDWSVVSNRLFEVFRILIKSQKNSQSA